MSLGIFIQTILIFSNNKFLALTFLYRDKTTMNFRIYERVLTSFIYTFGKQQLLTKLLEGREEQNRESRSVWRSKNSRGEFFTQILRSPYYP